MRWIDVMRISLRTLRTTLLRSLLSMFSIATAIGMIVTLVGLGYGVQNITIGSIVHSQSLLALEITPGKDNAAAALDATSAARFKKYPGIQDDSPVMTAEGQVSFNGKLISNGLEAGQANLIGMEGVSMSVGRHYRDGSAEVILSPQAVDLLETTPNDILNKTVQLSFVNPVTQQTVKLAQPVTVVGVTTPESVLMMIPFSLLDGIADVPVTSVKAVAKDRVSVIEAQQSFLTKGYAVESLIDTLDSAQKIFKWVTFGLVLIAVVALMVAAIGMFNTLTISLLERTRDIGIMKSIGITDSAVRKLFLTEAAILGFGGGLAGIALGLLITQTANLIIARLAVHYGGTAQNLFQYPNYFLLSMVVYPTLLSLATSLYPAIRSNNIQALVAVRSE